MLEFEQMKEWLITYEYPHIQIKDVDQIADIFHASNRKFLVTWLLHKINPEFELDDHEDLVDLLGCYGYWSNDQINGFLSGDLDVVETMDILYRLFSHMNNASSPKILEDGVSELGLNLQDLSVLDSTDVNIFPSLYNHLKMSSAEFDQDESQSSSKCDTLIDTIVEETEESKFDKSVVKTKLQNIDNLIDVIELLLPDALSCADRYSKWVNFNETRKMELESNILEKFNTNLENIVMFFENLKTITEFINKMPEESSSKDDTLRFQMTNKNSYSIGILSACFNILLDKDHHDFLDLVS